VSTTLIRADARAIPLADQSVHCVVTSPPYYRLRDYQVGGQIGLEVSPDAYIAEMLTVFREVWRVLRDDGTLWLNIGDSYAASGGVGAGGNLGRINRSYQQRNARPGYTGGALKPKDLMGIPWRLAFALQADGWFLRQDIVWAKPNPMPSPVLDRCVTAHEYMFLLSKSPRYYFDPVAIAEPSVTEASGNKTRRLGEAYGRPGAAVGVSVPWEGSTRNKRSVWTVSTEPSKVAHFATYPTKLVTPCILSGTSERGCCQRCGTPWRRLVDKVRRATRPGESSKIYEPNGSKQDALGKRTYTGFNKRWKESREVGNRDPLRHVTETVTTGWAASCTCNAGDPVPCVVFDPFCGAGTTVMVADRLGRHGIGIDLSERYLAYGRERIEADRSKRAAVASKRSRATKRLTQVALAG
jgi:DNA modification methylase